MASPQPTPPPPPDASVSSSSVSPPSNGSCAASTGACLTSWSSMAAYFNPSSVSYYITHISISLLSSCSTASSRAFSKIHAKALRSVTLPFYHSAVGEYCGSL